MKMQLEISFLKTTKIFEIWDFVIDSLKNLVYICLQITNFTSQVVETIEKSFELKKEQTESTWKVLTEKGNMSSGTVLFILDELRKEKNSHKYRDIVSLAFGPGLAMEGALLRKVGQDF